MSVHQAVALEIGAVRLVFEKMGEFPSFDISVDHQKFLSNTNGAFHSEIKAHYCEGGIKSPDLGQCVYDSGALWKLFEDPVHYSLELRVPPDNPIPFRLLQMDKDWKQGVLYCAKTSEGRLGHIVEYPIDEILVSNILARNIGVETHACCLDDNGRGILFIGESGAGKSTLARLFKGLDGVRILSDDRIIIGKTQGSFCAFGTPWHGDAGECHNAHIKIEKIFFLNGHGKLCAQPISIMEAAARMFVRCFPTFWNRKGISFTLECIGEIVQQIPCYQLDFLLEESTVDFVRNVP